VIDGFFDSTGNRKIDDQPGGAYVELSTRDDDPHEQRVRWTD